MRRYVMESRSILNWLEETYPDRTPTTKMTEFEYGELAGERRLIEQLKIKLKVNEEVEHEK